MTHNAQDPATLAAARFHARWLHIEQEPDEKELAAWLAWLQESPDHIRAALDASDVYERVGESDFVRNLDVDAWLSRRRAAVIRLPEASESDTRRSGRLKTLWRSSLAHKALIAGSAAVVIVAAVVAPRLFERAPVYSTALGEHRTVELPDGSVLQLNTRSRVRIAFDEQVRAIDLEGEALFTVSHDAQRPFLVRTRSATARAIGTRFNVYASGIDTTISVVEGVVQVIPGPASAQTVSLMAGEEARVQKGTAVKSAAPRVENRIAWQRHALVFENARLADVAAEFNRYNATQIRIDTRLADRRLSGTFDALYPRSLLLWLQSRGDVSVREEGNSVIAEPVSTGAR